MTLIELQDKQNKISIKIKELELYMDTPQYYSLPEYQQTVYIDYYNTLNDYFELLEEYMK